MVVPSILPTEAVALDGHVSKKRRLSAALDQEDDATTEQPYTTEPEDEAEPHEPQQVRIEDSDDEEDRHSLYEDILDTLESNPYLNDRSMGLSNQEVTRLRARLRQVGVEKFFDETVNEGMDERILGTAFGLDPNLAVDEDTFLRILSLAIVRSFHKRRKLTDYNTIDDAARLLRDSKKIMVITGAGISTSLGIPDFRSKSGGFYAKVAAMGLEGISEPQDVFDILVFDDDPSIFYRLAGDVLPDASKGISPTHAFIRLLQDKGKLQTNYTQNIDNLEELAGLSADKVIQCHGSFRTATCRKCKKQVQGHEIYEDIRNRRIPYCKFCEEKMKSTQPPSRPQKRSKPNAFDYDDEDGDDDIPEPGVMKPDITFFHEQLPDNFFTRFTEIDSKDTDLVIVIGTSLKVAPVSEMPNFLPHHIPHIYISMEPIRHVDFDIQLLGKCDDVVVELCKRAGWDFKHKMIKEDVELEVRLAEDMKHLSMVRPKEEFENLELLFTQSSQEPLVAPNTMKRAHDINEVESSDSDQQVPLARANGGLYCTPFPTRARFEGHEVIELSS